MFGGPQRYSFVLMSANIHSFRYMVEFLVQFNTQRLYDLESKKQQNQLKTVVLQVSCSSFSVF